MEGKKSFVAYTDWKEIFDSLSNEQAGALIKHIFAYVSDENPTTDDAILNISFIGIRQTLKRDLKKWKEKHQKRVEAGRAGGIAKAKRSKVKQNLAMLKSEKQNVANLAVSDSVSVSGNDSVSVTDGVGYRNGIDAADIVPMHITQVITELKTDNDWLNAFDYPPRKYVESQLPLFENHCIREKKVNRNKSETIKHFNAWMNRRWTGLSPETRKRYKP